MASETITVRVAELADRYILIDADSGEEVDADGVGFTSEGYAKEHAEQMGYIIADKTL